MNYIISAFTIGFIAAALPGAVQTTILQNSIIGKTKNSIKFALGAAMMDGLYLLLAYYGLVQLLVSHNWLKLIIGIFGSLYIAYIGILGLKNSIWNKDTKDIKNKSFLSGFLLVLLHVPTLLYFISVATTIFKEKTDLSNVVLSSIALSLGAMACFISVAFIGKLINKFGSKILIRIFNFSASVILIIFAIKTLMGLY